MRRIEERFLKPKEEARGVVRTLAGQHEAVCTTRNEAKVEAESLGLLG